MRNEQKLQWKRSIDVAKVLVDQADEVSRNAVATLALNLEGVARSDFSGDTPDNQNNPSRDSSEFDILKDEINSLLQSQEAAAESQSKCLEKLRESSESLMQGWDEASPSKQRQIALAMANALENFRRCMLHPRPQRVVDTGGG